MERISSCCSWKRRKTSTSRKCAGLVTSTIKTHCEFLSFFRVVDIKVHDKAPCLCVSVVSLQPGLRWWESPLHRSLCSADPVVGVVVHRARKGEERRGAQQLSEQTEAETLGYLLRLSHIDLSLFTASFRVYVKRTRAAAAAAAAAARGLVCCSRAAACEKTPKRGRLSWYELTYQTDMETKPFLSLGKFVCLMTSCV